MKTKFFVYQPWVKFGGTDGEIVIHSFSLHRSEELANQHLSEIVESLTRPNELGSVDVVIINKGVNKIEVLE